MTAIRHHDPVTHDVGGPHPRRSRWWWVGGAFVLLLVVVSAFILGRGGRTETPVAAAPTVTVAAAPPPASSVVVSASPGAVGEDTANPDGCLGGPDPYTAILPAQDAATLDVAGAAGFARAAARYFLMQSRGPRTSPR